MNNRGFAITTVLYGLLILFLLIVVSTLRILSSQREMFDMLIDETSGARDIVKLNTIEPFQEGNTTEVTEERALYKYSGCSKYYKAGVTISTSDFVDGCIN